MNKPLREPYMEDINAATVAAMNKLIELNIIDGEDRAQDILFDQISAVLEKHFNYPDYSNYN
jgi:hypothetical protein